MSKYLKILLGLLVVVSLGLSACATSAPAAAEPAAEEPAAEEPAAEEPAADAEALSIAAQNADTEEKPQSQHTQQTQPYQAGNAFIIFQPQRDTQPFLPQMLSFFQTIEKFLDEDTTEPQGNAQQDTAEQRL